MLGWSARCAFLLVVAYLQPPLAAQAEILKFTATLSPAATVPPTASNASGASEFTYNRDTRQLEFTVLYQDLRYGGRASAGERMLSLLQEIEAAGTGAKLRPPRGGAWDEDDPGAAHRP